jgi:hypothetical protein
MASAAAASAVSRRPARPRRQPCRKGRRSTGTRTCDTIGQRPRAVEARGGVSVATRPARRVCVADRRGPSHRGGSVWGPCSGACFGRLKPGSGRERGGPKAAREAETGANEVEPRRQRGGGRYLIYRLHLESLTAVRSAVGGPDLAR